MDADGAVAVAFLVDGEGGLVAVLVKVSHAQPAGGGKPDAGVEVGFEDGAVAEIEHVVAGGKPHQLPGAGGCQRPCALQRIGRLAGDELGVGGIRDVDGQPEFGGGAGEIFVEAGERGEMRRLRVLGALGALVAAIMALRQRCTSATEASSSLKASCGQRRPRKSTKLRTLRR